MAKIVYRSITSGVGHVKERIGRHEGRSIQTLTKMPKSMESEDVTLQNTGDEQINIFEMKYK